MNSVNIVGRLTRDPEMKQAHNTGNAIATFSVAVNRPFKNPQGTYDADFINCVAFGKTAEFVHKYFVKGQFIGVTGRLQTRKWMAEDGSNRYAMDVVADNVHFTAPGDKGQAYVAKPSADNLDLSDFGGFNDLPDDDDELPFM